MSTPLRLLLIEDSPDDAHLLERDLKRNGYDPLIKRVESRTDLKTSLAGSEWDIVISDYAMPGFSGMEALEIYKSFDIDIPFILMSGAVEEENIIEAMVRGAHDYVMKDRRGRLFPAIERELREASLRRQKGEMEARFRALFETMSQGVIYYDATGRIISANSAAERIVGTPLSEMSEPGTINGRRQAIHEDGSPYGEDALPVQIALTTGKPVWGVLMGIYHKNDEKYRWITIDAVPQFQGTASTPFEVYTTLTDITERKEAEEALQHSEARYRRMTEAVTDYTYTIVIRDGLPSLTRHGPGCLAVTGYNPEEFAADSGLWIRIVVPDDRQLVSDQVRRLAIHGESSAIEHRIVKKDGMLRWVRSTTVLRHNGDRRSYEYDGLIQDITDRRLAEQALKESEERYRRLYELSPLGYQSLDGDGRIVDINQAWVETFGYEKNEVIGRWFGSFLTSEAVKNFMKLFEDAKEAGKGQTEFEMRRKDGTTLLILLDGRVGHDEDGRFKQMHCILHDITMRKKAEEDVKTSLREKEILLREIHHRVKNNLQIISSLLNLQSAYIKDRQALDMFKESINRIRTMAHIHEKLYRSADYSRINFSDYIDELASQLYTSYGLTPELVTLKVEVAEVPLDINTAIPLGLIINELVSNAMKHAFPDGRKGEIAISMTKQKDGIGEDGGDGVREIKNAAEQRLSRIVLRVSDNGIGFPEGLDFRKTDSLGLQLVMELTEQLEGTVDLARTGGTEFIVCFKKEL